MCHQPLNLNIITTVKYDHWMDAMAAELDAMEMTNTSLLKDYLMRNIL